MNDLKFNYKYKVELVNNISKLDEIEHMHIYRMIKEDTDKFTQNKNGLFINLSNISDKKLFEIKEYVDLNIKNNQEKEKEMLKNVYKNEEESENKEEINNDDDDNDDNNEEMLYEEELLERDDEEYSKEQELNTKIIEKMHSQTLNIIDDKKENEEPDYIKKMKFVGIRAKILKNSRDNKSVSSFFKTTTKDLELEKIDD
tara:strand:+ start:132 stop:731 length:600 start_codon:yes stop_codon:yes gene_type:complete